MYNDLHDFNIFNKKTILRLHRKTVNKKFKDGMILLAVECADVHVSLGDDLFMSCTFDLTHEYRKQLRAATNVTTTKQVSQIVIVAKRYKSYI